MVPALPTIRSARLMQQIFTHASLNARPRDEFEASQDDPMCDNEGWLFPLPTVDSRLKSLEDWRTSGVKYLLWRLPILFRTVIHCCTSGLPLFVEASSFASSLFLTVGCPESARPCQMWWFTRENVIYISSAASTC